MKKYICLLLALLALVTPVLAETAAPETVRLAFEDGFSLTLPAGWVRYELDPALADEGYIYCLGSADGAQLMYIQRWASDVTDLEELVAALEERMEIELRSTNTSDSGEAFLMYRFSLEDSCGGMLIHDGSILNLLFTPQSDDALMLTAATILASFSAE